MSRSLWYVDYALAHTCMQSVGLSVSRPVVRSMHIVQGWGTCAVQPGVIMCIAPHHTYMRSSLFRVALDSGMQVMVSRTVYSWPWGSCAFLCIFIHTVLTPRTCKCNRDTDGSLTGMLPLQRGWGRLHAFRRLVALWTHLPSREQGLSSRKRCSVVVHSCVMCTATCLQSTSLC